MRLLIAGLLLTACDRATPERVGLDAPHRSAIIDSVTETLAAFRAAVAVMDVDSVASFYAADSAFRWIEDGELRYRSREAVAAALREAAPYMGNSMLVYDGTVVTPLGPGVASLVTGFAQRFTTPDGVTGGFAGVITAVLVHRHGRWQFLQGHTSSLGGSRRPSQ